MKIILTKFEYYFGHFWPVLAIFLHFKSCENGIPFFGIVLRQKNEKKKLCMILPVLDIFRQFFTFLSIFVIFSPYLVISDILEPYTPNLSIFTLTPL